jgi:O-antigen/teichoic acid export membrane protein
MATAARRFEASDAAAVTSPARGLGRLFANIVRKGTLAVTDQALFSGANFLVNILLARWLAPADYGAYSLAFAIFLLFAAIHSAILIEPMMVFGPGKYASGFGRYVRILVGGHFAVMTGSSVALLGLTLLLGRFYSSAAALAMRGLAFGAAAILLFWLVRRVFYVLLRPALGVVSGALYFVLLLGGVGLLKYFDLLSTMTAFCAMGGAGLLASAVMLARFAPDCRSGASQPTFKEVSVEHWRYGRWAIATAVIGWFPGQVYYALLPAYLGLEGAGALRALMNFVMPVLQAISALTMLLLPMLVRDRHSGGPKKMNRTMLVFLGLFCAGAVVYLAGLWLFRDSVFQIFYGGKYAQYAGWPLLLTGLLPLGTCASSVLGDGLRALEKPDSIFWCYAGSVIGAVAVGIPLSAVIGVSGALLGLLASSIITVAMMSWYYKKSLIEADKA